MSTSPISELDRDTSLDRLQSYCDQFHIKLSDEQICRCLNHLALVIEVNKKMNLTRKQALDKYLGIVKSALSYGEPAFQGSPSLSLRAGLGFFLILLARRSMPCKRLLTLLV